MKPHRGAARHPFTVREYLGRRCLLIGEVGQAHDGSLGAAHAYIDAIAGAGADAVKFQTHIAEAESTLREPWRVPFSPQDETRYEYWKRMEFSEAQWRGLREHATQRGLVFLSTPFSIQAAQLLHRVGVGAWKVSSGELGNLPLLQVIAGFGLPVLLSTGMSPLSQIDAAVACVRARGAPLVLLQCTSLYPTPAERVGLNMLPLLRERYGCPAGLSDHSGTIYPALAAAVLGAAVIEVHVTLSRESFGPDVAASVTTAEFQQLVAGVRFIERMISTPVQKDIVAEELAGVRQVFAQSIVASTDLPTGTVLRDEHLALKKPGAGLPPSSLHHLMGRRLRRALKKDECISEADVGEVDGA